MATYPIRLGLTGGIGSGKSTVASMLQKLSAVVVDADAIARELTASNGEALPHIVALFGPNYIDIDGKLNRDKMRATVFKEPWAKRQLEDILHPLIREKMLMRARSASFHGAACVVFDIPLLVESGSWRNFVDCVLVVDCTPETQMNRVKARNGFSDAEVRTILAAQASRAWRLRAADIVLFNDNCSLANLAVNVRAIAQKIGL